MEGSSYYGVCPYLLVRKHAKGCNDMQCPLSYGAFSDFLIEGRYI